MHLITNLGMAVLVTKNYLIFSSIVQICPLEACFLFTDYFIIIPLLLAYDMFYLYYLFPTVDLKRLFLKEALVNIFGAEMLGTLKVFCRLDKLLYH
jgi:hypothetical protein